jgi:hypothetical protein
MTESAYANSLRRFENDWPQFEAVAVTNELVRTSGRLAERHLLRGFDSVHLASALALQQGSEGVTFSAWDGRLLAAAESEGLVVAPIGPDLPIA